MGTENLTFVSFIRSVRFCRCNFWRPRVKNFVERLLNNRVYIYIFILKLLRLVIINESCELFYIYYVWHTT